MIKVSLAFYATATTKRAMFVQSMCLHKIFHCGLMVEENNKTIVLAADKNHNPRFVPANLYHDSFFIVPDYIIELGTSDVRVEQLINFMCSRYPLDSISFAVWFFVGRWFSKSFRPNSCSILSAQLARICGFQVEDFTLPKNLYYFLKEQDNTTHYTWEEYCKKEEIPCK